MQYFMHFTAVLINSGYLPGSPYKSLFDACKGTLRNLFIDVTECKSSTRFMCLIINHFVMYYSNPQVNYMVTVFIRLVSAVV